MTKMLVVDDAAFVRMQYRKSLSENGYEVIEATNGEEALEKYQECQPDGVLLDINMPVMDGLVTLHQILTRDPEARVAMISCIGAQSVVLSALRSGARDFLVKPAGGNGLIDAVHKLLS